VSGPGVASEPRDPQNLARTQASSARSQNIASPPTS
jgi:hypothetical protein